MYLDGTFWGFIFFNSRTAGRFDDAALRTLDVYAHLISAIVTAEMLAVRVLAAAVKTAHDMVHFRDPETGAHMERMGRYSRLIAQHLAGAGIASLDDALIEQIFEFAPLHDLGKLAVPDRILLKAGRLTEDERNEMKLHTTRGREMVDAIAHNFGLERLDGLDLLRHIAESHHETLDGKGYPEGPRIDAIPPRRASWRSGSTSSMCSPACAPTNLRGPTQEGAGRPAQAGTIEVRRRLHRGARLNLGNMGEIQARFRDGWSWRPEQAAEGRLLRSGAR